MSPEEIFGYFIGFCIGFCIIILIVTLPTMWLWNSICPQMFGLPEITFWQTLGLMILCRLLFAFAVPIPQK